MLKVGFEARSVNLIMMCVNSVTYSILHNAEASDKLIPLSLFVYSLPKRAVIHHPEHAEERPCAWL